MNIEKVKTLNQGDILSVNTKTPFYKNSKSNTDRHQVASLTKGDEVEFCKILDNGNIMVENGTISYVIDYRCVDFVKSADKAKEIFVDDLKTGDEVTISVTGEVRETYRQHKGYIYTVECGDAHNGFFSIDLTPNVKIIAHSPKVRDDYPEGTIVRDPDGYAYVKNEHGCWDSTKGSPVFFDEIEKPEILYTPTDTDKDEF